MALAVRAALPSCFSDKYMSVAPSLYVSLPRTRLSLSRLEPLKSFASLDILHQLPSSLPVTPSLL
jgi:hypothetical protein